MPRALEHGAFSGLIGYFPIQNKMPVNRMEQEACMDQRIAILGIIVEDEDSVEQVNELLHEYREYIVGRMRETMWSAPYLENWGCWKALAPRRCTLKNKPGSWQGNNLVISDSNI